VGLAYLNPSLRLIGACEFADDEHFCGLEAALVQLGAREAALPKVRAPAAGPAGGEGGVHCGAGWPAGRVGGKGRCSEAAGGRPAL
jgi:hypothetical protein